MESSRPNIQFAALQAQELGAGTRHAVMLAHIYFRGMTFFTSCCLDGLPD